MSRVNFTVTITPNTPRPNVFTAETVVQGKTISAQATDENRAAEKLTETVRQFYKNQADGVGASGAKTRDVLIETYNRPT